MGIHFGIYLAGKAHATRCCNSNLSLPPSSGGRLGWGWLCDFRSKQTRTTRRTTLSPALSRRTGEGGGLQVKIRSSENSEIRVLKKLVPDFFRRPFTQSKQTCDNSSSVGFAHKTYHLTIQIRQQPNGYPFRHLSRGQSPCYSLLQQQSVPSPVRRGKVRMGVAL